MPFLVWEFFWTLRALWALSGTDMPTGRGGRVARWPVISAGRVLASTGEGSAERSAAWARRRSPAPRSSAQVVCPDRNKRPMPVTICNATAKAQRKCVRPLA